MKYLYDVISLICSTIAVTFFAFEWFSGAYEPTSFEVMCYIMLMAIYLKLDD
jgi:hypothetical protein